MSGRVLPVPLERVLIRYGSHLPYYTPNGIRCLPYGGMVALMYRKILAHGHGLGVLNHAAPTRTRPDDS